MVTTSPVSAMRIRIGATPATLTMDASTTPVTSPAATPASTAFPPPSSTSMAASADK